MQAVYHSEYRDVSSSTSDFYNYYKIPTIREGNSRKKNLLFIYAEGLERTYFDEALFPGLITHLREIESEAFSFTDIRQVPNTNFTIAGMVASQSGIPLFSKSGNNSMGGMDEFLPGAKSLGDLLKNEGYYLSFYGGANLIFAGKGKFYKTHGFDEVKGYVELVHSTKNTAYRSNWGLYDDTLLDLAYDRFMELSESEERVGMFLVTLDTHHPNGHMSRSVEHLQYSDGSNSILNSIVGSDYLLAEFINRVRDSKHGDDTVIVLVSDHLALRNTATPILSKGQRRNLFLILDPDRRGTSEGINTRGSSFDIGVTVLPFIGYQGLIGLGRDLLNADLNEEEIAHIASRDSLYGWKDDILRFWEFPRLDKSIEVMVESKTVKVDERIFSLPILIELGPDYETTLKFEFFTSHTLANHVESLSEDQKYILIENKNGWTMTLGKGMGILKEIALDEYLKLDKENLEFYFSNQSTHLK